MKGVKEDCKELQKLDDAVILESFGISRSLVKHAKPKCYMYDWYVGEMDHAEDLDKDGGVNDTYMNDRGMRDVQEECKHTNPWFEIVSVNSGVKIRTLPDDYPLVHVLSSRGLPEDYFSVERLKRLFLDQYTKSLRKFLPHSTETELVHCARTSSDVFFVPHVLPHLRCTTDKQFRRLIEY
ncbi:hypothetical protein GNI_022390 [Gregarina niphandrodes]|uniref:Uncharacterized protein n=1 Tax=Gregarina niphandrodes TaxID=110365 RepID=A0A023BBW8_GRENI|nr:hypothetical protein GNI_022390 [Gregarina niphandrodes]EZG80166.1 hypothetical protein GNI_022390 [Gregarina niphandrodes]|eukprot:XP_011134323.1 hypothetical protein GNI_022390 [Gregarina niphandrodes]